MAKSHLIFVKPKSNTVLRKNMCESHYKSSCIILNSHRVITDDSCGHKKTTSQLRLEGDSETLQGTPITHTRSNSLLTVVVDSPFPIANSGCIRIWPIVVIPKWMVGFNSNHAIILAKRKPWYTSQLTICVYVSCVYTCDRAGLKLVHSC